MFVNNSFFDCNECGLPLSNEDHFVSKKTNKLICIDCMLEENPPSMTIGRDSDIKKFWNFNLGGYELWQTDLGCFKNCGWVVRRHVEELDPKNTENFKHMYVLEYRGLRKCRRCADYKYFSDSTPLCDGKNCCFHEIRAVASK